MALLAHLSAVSATPSQPDDSALRLSIPNMVCMSCEMRIEQALMAVEGVQQVAFVPGELTAVVHYTADQASLDAILQASADAGYPATVLPAED